MSLMLEFMRNHPNGAYCIAAYISAEDQFRLFVRSFMCSLDVWPIHYWRGKIVEKNP